MHKRRNIYIKEQQLLQKENNTFRGSIFTMNIIKRIVRYNKNPVEG